MFIFSRYKICSICCNTLKDKLAVLFGCEKTVCVGLCVSIIMNNRSDTSNNKLYLLLLDQKKI